MGLYTVDYVYNMSEIEIKRCLNCGDLVSNRTLMYDNHNFCTGQCKDGYQRRNQIHYWKKYDLEEEN